jgi:hypothetical protein
MFFYVSGASSTFFKEKKGFIYYFTSRFGRLMIPFFLAIPTILIPRLYITQEYQDFSRCDDHGHKFEEWNIPAFYKCILPTLWKQISWLWFLPSIFLDSILNYPLLCWANRRSRREPFSWSIDGSYILGLFAVFGFWIGVQMMTSHGTESLVNMAVITLCTQIVMFAAIPFAQKFTPNCYFCIKLIGLVSSFIHNHYQLSGDYETIYGFLSKINYDLIFMGQGIIDFLCIEHHNAEWDYIQT